MRAITAAALAAGLALVACKGSPEEAGGGGGGAPPGDRLTESEAERGRQACRAYAEQVCRCAKTNADLKPECDMSGGRLQALEMSARAAMAEGNATAKDRSDLLANVRKIARGCIEDSAKLVTRGCPLEAGGSAGEQSGPAGEAGGSAGEAGGPSGEAGGSADEKGGSAGEAGGSSGEAGGSADEPAAQPTVPIAPAPSPPG